MISVVVHTRGRACTEVRVLVLLRPNRLTPVRPLYDLCTIITDTREVITSSPTHTHAHTSHV